MVEYHYVYENELTNVLHITNKYNARMKYIVMTASETVIEERLISRGDAHLIGEALSFQSWIQGIGVKNDMQGKGIGTKLLKHIDKYAKEKGVGYITLNTGFKRTDAHAFYERNGYSSGNYCYGKNP